MKLLQRQQQRGSIICALIIVTLIIVVVGIVIYKTVQCFQEIEDGQIQPPLPLTNATMGTIAIAAVEGGFVSPEAIFAAARAALPGVGESTITVNVMPTPKGVSLSVGKRPMPQPDALPGGSVAMVIERSIDLETWFYVLTLDCQTNVMRSFADTQMKKMFYRARAQ